MYEEGKNFMNIHVFFHDNDLDGRASGAILKKSLQELMKLSVILHPYNYGDPFPYNEISSKDVLYFADVVVTPYSEMVDIYKKYDTTIIDHHQSFINFISYRSDIQIFKGIQVSDKRSACELTWNYLFPNDKTPLPIKLLSSYDTWDNTDQDFWNTVVLPFQYGMKVIETSPIINWLFWEQLLSFTPEQEENFVAETAKNGQIILKYQETTNKKIVSTNSFETNFNELRTICCNSNLKTSDLYNSVWDEKKYDIMLTFDINKNGLYSVSLYTTKEHLDVSAIAKKYGGGGHKKAAGFSAKNMIIMDDVLMFKN